MQKIYKFFSKEKYEAVEDDLMEDLPSRISSKEEIVTCYLPVDALIDIFRFLPRKVLCQRIQSTNSLMFRLCNSENVPNIHRIQLIVFNQYIVRKVTSTEYYYDRYSRNIFRRLRAITRWKVNQSFGINRIFLNPTQDSLDVDTFRQLPLPATQIVRFGRVTFWNSLEWWLIEHLVKMQQMFDGCRLELFSYFFQTYHYEKEFRELFDNVQIRECSVSDYDYHSGPSSVLLKPILVADRLDVSARWLRFISMSEYIQKYQYYESDLPEKDITKEFIQWLHHKEGEFNARRHLTLKERDRSDDEQPLYKIRYFLDEIVQRFQSAVIPCNFMVTWLTSSYPDEEPFDLFNKTTGERLSLFQRESDPNIFRLWRRQCTLEAFNTLLPTAGDKTAEGNVWKDPFYHHGFMEKLQRSRDIPKVPHNWWRLPRYQIMSKKVARKFYK
ncbi:hypothetical protein Ddc_11635 [Ditylenchus destructor]|nr:hypothetical protein Ddc_11635 [Ditylenchus destructor]